ncbi:unnamed protein product [Moneuplotes crassus]|uniref:LITAF domain-containing protein n=1 Tax=Euplotes crassus TaxID=5936 RepID=A0AAD2D583_EUPCR|nr:unnamed protein product [Moneuplotes crassus]
MRIGKKSKYSRNCDYLPFTKQFQGTNNGVSICTRIQSSLKQENSFSSVLSNSLTTRGKNSVKILPNIRINASLRKIKGKKSQTPPHQAVNLCRGCGELPQPRFRLRTTTKQWILCCILLLLFCWIPCCCYLPFCISKCYSRKEYYLKCQCGVWK